MGDGVLVVVVWAFRSLTGIIARPAGQEEEGEEETPQEQQDQAPESFVLHFLVLVFLLLVGVGVGQ